MSVLRLLLRAGVCASGLCFLGWIFFQGTSTWQNLDLNASVARLALAALDGPTVLAIICTWGALLLAVLLTLALRALGPSGSASGAATPFSLVRTLLAWQLPPRVLFASWCGGLSLAEALGVGGWLGLNLWWLFLGLHNGIQPGDPWDVRLNATAKLLGQMTAPNLMLLFLPIPHTNVLTWLTGVSRNRLIRFHRWMGHGTLWVVLLHSVLYYVYWGMTNTFWVNFKDWGEGPGGSNNLAGSLAFFFGLALWGTSLSFVRRRMYELFFRCHITCFVGFFLLSCAHYSSAWLYFTPGLLLYAADLALRGVQMSNTTAITAATIDEGSGTATLLIRADKALQHRPPSEVWLLVPALTRWQWHPFSLASGGGDTLKCHIKQYGRFTGGLLRALRQRRPLAVRLSGPMGSEVTASGCQLAPPPSWRCYDAVVMVAGGVGVTAMLGMLRAMLEAHQAAEAGRASAEGFPCSVVCVWTARQAGEFLSLDSSLLAAASAKHGWLSLRLHLTGGGQRPARANPRAVLPSPTDSRRACDSSRHTSGSSTSSTSGLDAAAPPLPGVPAGPLRMAGASPYFWSMLRPAQPLAFSTVQLAAVYALTYFGAFCAALVATSYMQEAVLWQGGMLACVLISAVATGLPAFFAIFPVHQARYLRAVADSRRGGPAGDQACVVPYEDQVLLHSEACVLASGAVMLPGGTAGVRIREGRPDIPALLRSAAAKSASPVVGVYAGGPAGLMKSVHLTVCSLNSEGGGAHFELHNESVEL